MTINELLSLEKSVKQRLNKLESQQSQVLNRERSWFGDNLQNKTEKEPVYDPTDLDLKICELSNFLRKLDAAVKQANATTSVVLEVNEESLFASIKPYNK